MGFFLFGFEEGRYRREGQILILIGQAYKCQISSWVAFVLGSERKIAQTSGQYNSMYEVPPHFLNSDLIFLNFYTWLD